MKIEVEVDEKLYRALKEEADRLGVEVSDFVADFLRKNFVSEVEQEKFKEIVLDRLRKLGYVD